MSKNTRTILQRLIKDNINGDEGPIIHTLLMMFNSFSTKIVVKGDDDINKMIQGQAEMLTSLVAQLTSMSSILIPMLEGLPFLNELLQLIINTGKGKVQIGLLLSGKDSIKVEIEAEGAGEVVKQILNI